MFDFEPPEKRDGIVTALSNLTREIDDYLEPMTDEVFETPQGEFWSPAGHIRHLGKSVRAVTRGMSQPRLLLKAFGRTDRRRSFTQVVEVYHQALADGGKAGKFGPSEATPSRDEVTERFLTASRQLECAVADWSEEQLDRYRLPHPLIGKLTVREMLFFTLYHNAHHVRRIHERKAP